MKKPTFTKTDNGWLYKNIRYIPIDQIDQWGFSYSKESLDQVVNDFYSSDQNRPNFKFNHDLIIGLIKDLSLKTDGLYADVELLDDSKTSKESARINELVQAGAISQTSFGVKPLEKNGNKIMKMALMDLSFVDRGGISTEKIENQEIVYNSFNLNLITPEDQEMNELEKLKAELEKLKAELEIAKASKSSVENQEDPIEKDDLKAQEDQIKSELEKVKAELEMASKPVENQEMNELEKLKAELEKLKAELEIAKASKSSVENQEGKKEEIVKNRMESKVSNIGTYIRNHKQEEGLVFNRESTKNIRKSAESNGAVLIKNISNKDAIKVLKGDILNNNNEIILNAYSTTSGGVNAPSIIQGATTSNKSVSIIKKMRWFPVNNMKARPPLSFKGTYTGSMKVPEAGQKKAITISNGKFEVELQKSGGIVSDITFESILNTETNDALVLDLIKREVSELAIEGMESDFYALVATQATLFSATTIPTVVEPNEADVLIASAILSKISNGKPNIALVSETFNFMLLTKSEKFYVYPLAEGLMMQDKATGIKLEVVTSASLDSNKFIVCELAVLQGYVHSMRSLTGQLSKLPVDVLNSYGLNTLSLTDQKIETNELAVVGEAWWTVGINPNDKAQVIHGDFTTAKTALGT